MKNLIKCGLAVVLLSIGSSASADIPNDINLQRNILAPLYTHSSEGERRYEGKQQPVYGFLDGKEIGKIGVIKTDGSIDITLPETLPDSVLSPADEPNIISSNKGKIVFIEDPHRGQRTISEGNTGRGGTLTTQPSLTLWKNDKEILVQVYVNQDYNSSDMGIFNKGWNYASNVDHRRAKSVDGYRWVIIDDQK